MLHGSDVDPSPSTKEENLVILVIPFEYLITPFGNFQELCEIPYGNHITEIEHESKIDGTNFWLQDSAKLELSAELLPSKHAILEN